MSEGFQKMPIIVKHKKYIYNKVKINKSGFNVMWGNNTLFMLTHNLKIAWRINCAIRMWAFMLIYADV